MDNFVDYNRSQFCAKNLENNHFGFPLKYFGSDVDRPKLRLHLLSCGYIRKYLTSRNVNPCDIGCIVVKFLFQDWKFDYFYDFLNNGATIHGIENNGKTLKCNCAADDVCYCFFSIFSFGMKPQSGKYKIKFKINAISNDCYPNIIGIISKKINQERIQILQNNNDDRYMYEWDNGLSDYIGWSADTRKPQVFMKNQLFLGWNDKTNIFYKNNFIYCSNNKNYKTRLPAIKTGDIIVLEYNSDLSILSFSKENDNGKLDSYISNLPQDLIFYWFVGHCWGEMTLTVV